MDTKKPFGIETRYRGTTFRSRLEARWAAFFDFCRWPWEYEPYDMQGWIPDFLLKFPSPLLVEVKPINVLSECHGYWPKIASARPSHPVLLLGASLFSANRFGTEHAIVGEAMGDLLRQQVLEGTDGQEWEGETASRSDCSLIHIGKCLGHDGIGMTIGTGFGGAPCLVCGCHSYATDSFVASHWPDNPAMSLWAASRNATQWKPNQ